MIADDPFLMPSDAFWADMRSTSSFEEKQSLERTGEDPT